MRKSQKNLKFLFAYFLSCGFLAGCSQVSESSNSLENDPLEPMNRSVFYFNQAMDKTIIKPVAKGYRTTVPEPARQSVSNVFDVIKQPARLGNALLQGEFKDSGWIITRTAVNLTFGFFGLFDAATEMNIPHPSYDFGQTLAKWGWKEGGPYLVLPFLGPSNARDAVGTGVDFLADVTRWKLQEEPVIVWGSVALNGLSQREKALDLLENLENSSTDYYTTLRTMYLQNRQKKLGFEKEKDDKGTPSYDVDFEIEEDEN